MRGPSSIQTSSQKPRDIIAAAAAGDSNKGKLNVKEVNQLLKGGDVSAKKVVNQIRQGNIDASKKAKAKAKAAAAAAKRKK